MFLYLKKLIILVQSYELYLEKTNITSLIIDVTVEAIIKWKL